LHDQITYEQYSEIVYRGIALGKNTDVYVALLRAINLGSINKVPMKDLALMFADAGCASVKSYIQSGNVVFTAPKGVCDGLCEKMSTQIEKRFGHKPPMMLRTAGQMAKVVRYNPYAKPGADDKTLHVVFLADKPKKEDIARLDPNRSPGDEYTFRGQEIYLRLPNGMGNSKLTNAYLDSKLQTISTSRNWRTTQTLLEMMTDLSKEITK
jgi:uncharacterized protein (DUF1697 family)